ncbi:NAD(P)H-dependent oxidoreductase [Limosilactobacillus sp. RRLNB_1_1]|uniref:FMN dependent NADH:quinone oxidoreductase n=1 Tax=Limosilactobacillus albertensis TaxID=2759752 RepID=A0A7W3TSA6_9LACO|nr:NAD(P)H-dependent oxidoreductase [Limosilactobacillus albertensis]MBB1069953.1 NAD(P)H-dependent oxidoreductase [Limosilactobacillus albertensis]MCD7117190.1 NAD(P)H-dependent oxidoreductase [Limosilactobacillus albertensis]MCD7128794.1 NAD(P)H-dependent oxidoreductase [Limosilactobacillus albertensis]
MSTLLVIQAHPHVENSLSLTVGKQFVESYEASHPNDKVIIRDLYAKDGVPPLNDVTMAAWQKQKFDEQLTAEETNLLQKHEEWLNEFINADKYVFINPMYNHFLPAEMKQYLDLTAVAHKTFKYTSDGSVGLLKGKKAIHIQAAGSEYHKNGKWGIIKFAVRKALKIKSKESCALMDLGDLYLTNMLKFYGITNVEKLFVEGADAHREQRQVILENAMKEAKSMATAF